MKYASEFTIFMVDDDPFFLCLLEKMIHNAGFPNVTGFEPGAIFLENLNQKPDLIFLDYHMDPFNGLEMMKMIKRNNPDSIVVFISGQGNSDVANNAFKYGAFDYLLKSEITELNIKNMIEKIMTRKEMRRRNDKSKLFHGVFSAIYLPVLIYLILETFFK